MAMMKIVAFVEYFPPKMGSDRRIFELMKKLSKCHEVHFIVFPPLRILIGKAKNITKNERSQQKNTSIAREGIKGHTLEIPHFIAAIWRSSILMAYILTAPLLLIKTLKILAETKPDIIVLNYPSPYTGLLGLILGKLWRKPIVLDFSDLIAQYTANLLDLKKDDFKARMLVYIQNYIARNSQRVVAPTLFIKKYVMSHGIPAGKVTLIPNGVDTENFNPQRYDSNRIKKEMGLREKKICFYCGRLDSWAGINLMSKLCEIADNRGANVKFVLVGSGEQKIALKKNVVLCGELPYKEVPRILSAADIVLIPFPDNEVSHAASPLKLFEGMAMQKPVIASRVKGIEEVVSDGENGFLADPENVEEWLTKLEKVLQSWQDAMRVGQNARRTVEERFDWGLLAKQFEKVLTIAIAEHHKPR
ncbi:MAG: glycosyltransferase family 4 protein [Candidatus Bathyarchaeales archaeon]